MKNSDNRKEMERLAQDMQDFSVAATRQVMMWVHLGTIREFNMAPGTPVRTGRAKSGGRVTRNAPSEFVPAEGFGSYPIPGLNHVDYELSGLKFGDKVFWVNNTPYFNILEGGRRRSSTGRMIGSEHAPSGVLNKAIQSAELMLRNWQYYPRQGAYF